MNRQSARSDATRERLRVSLPGSRPALRGIAVEAQARLNDAIAALTSAERGWLAECPLQAALAAGAAAPSAMYERLPRAFNSLTLRVRQQGGDAWVDTYGRLVLYAALAELPSRTPRLRLPGAVWIEVERSLSDLPRAIAKEAAVDMRGGAFARDLGVAQLRMIPYDGMVGVLLRIHPWYASAEASLPVRAGLVRYLGPETFRSVNVVEGHEWRGYRERGRLPWEIHVEHNAALAAVNPLIRGVVARGWNNDPALRAMSPALVAKADGIVAGGGYRFPITTPPSATAQALEVSATRRRHYEEGTYVPRSYATFFKRSRLLRWALNRWDAG